MHFISRRVWAATVHLVYLLPLLQVGATPKNITYSVASQQNLIVKWIITLLLLLFLTNSSDPRHFGEHLSRFIFSITGTRGANVLGGVCWIEWEREGGKHSLKYNIWTTWHHLWLPPQASGKRFESPQDPIQLRLYEYIPCDILQHHVTVPRKVALCHIIDCNTYTLMITWCLRLVHMTQRYKKNTVSFCVIGWITDCNLSTSWDFISGCLPGVMSSGGLGVRGGQRSRGVLTRLIAEAKPLQLLGALVVDSHQGAVFLC